MKGVVKGAHGGVVPAVGVPELGCDEDLFTRNAAGANGFAHASLVAVDKSGIDVTIADIDGVVDMLNQFFVVGNLPGSEADARNFDVVCKTKAAGNGGQNKSPKVFLNGPVSIEAGKGQASKAADDFCLSHCIRAPL